MILIKNMFKVIQAQEKGWIGAGPGFVNLINALHDCQSKLADLEAYGFIEFPLVYTQVIHTNKTDKLLFLPFTITFLFFYISVHYKCGINRWIF